MQEFNKKLETIKLETIKAVMSYLFYNCSETLLEPSIIINYKIL